jgi:hypothetical protein
MAGNHCPARAGFESPEAGRPKLELTGFQAKEKRLPQIEPEQMRRGGERPGQMWRRGIGNCRWFRACDSASITCAKWNCGDGDYGAILKCHFSRLRGGGAGWIDMARELL